jgi:dsDNA-specific endonuclease/ATPase MutS2
MNKFSTGERVGFLHEKGKAEVITYVNIGHVKILNEFGIEEIRLEKDLIKIHSENYLLPTKEVVITKSKKQTRSQNSTKHQIQKENTWEIDLHIEHLVDSRVGLSNTEILLKQLNQFKSTFSKAKFKRINKLIVIHGVGEGVLKNEIRTFLSKQEHLEFYDASYIEYGKGATEIKFYHSKY